MYFCLSPPARQISTLTSLKCSPLAHAVASFGDALSTTLVMLKSQKSARSAASEPALLTTDLGWCTPQLNDNSSIQPLCAASVLSPGHEPIFINASNAILLLLKFPSFLV